MAPHTRPRPTAVDQLPEECEGIVAWAAQELAKTPDSQKDIYAKFRTKLLDLQADIGISFVIPHYSSFTRHNVRIKTMMDRQRRVQSIAEAMVTGTDGQDEDKLTRAATLMLRTLIVEMMEGAADGGFKPKEAASAAAAMRHLAAAEHISTARLERIRAQTKEVVEVVGRAEGISQETMDKINRKLGVL